MFGASTGHLTTMPSCGGRTANPQKTTMANNSDDQPNADVIASARGRRVGSPFMVDAQARARGDYDWPVRSVHSERRDHGCKPRPAPSAGRVASSKVFPPRDDTV